MDQYPISNFFVITSNIEGVIFLKNIYTILLHTLYNASMTIASYIFRSKRKPTLELSHIQKAERSICISILKKREKNNNGGPSLADLYRNIYIFFSRYKLNDEKLYKPMAPSNTRQNNSIDIQKRKKKNEGGKSFFLYVTFYRLSKRRKIPADSRV